MTNRPAPRNQPSGGWGCLVPFFAAMLFLIWPYCVWHGCKYGGQDLSGCGAQSEWVWNGRSWTACGIWWGLLITPVVVAVVSAAGKRRSVRPPKGRLPIEVLPDAPASGPPMSSLPPAPQFAPPVCVHPDAIRVDSSAVPGLIWRCWCPACDPDCENPLPADFRLPCCGAEPGNGIIPPRHMYNCPRAQ